MKAWVLSISQLLQTVEKPIETFQNFDRNFNILNFPAGYIAIAPIQQQFCAIEPSPEKALFIKLFSSGVILGYVNLPRMQLIFLIS